MITKPLPFVIEDEDLKNRNDGAAEQSLAPRTECSSHTPGPWFANPTSSKGTTWLVISADAELGPCVAVDGERDARLIAAAPDMLAALQAAVHPKCIGFATATQQFFRDNDASREAIRLIRAAIAKASGDEHSVRDASSAPQLSHCGSPKATGEQS